MVGRKERKKKFSRNMRTLKINMLTVKTETCLLYTSILNALGVSSDMVLTDVLETGYTVKNSMLNEKLEKLAPEDRYRIYEVIDTLVKQSKQILP